MPIGGEYGQVSHHYVPVSDEGRRREQEPLGIEGRRSRLEARSSDFAPTLDRGHTATALFTKLPSLQLHPFPGCSTHTGRISARI